MRIKIEYELRLSEEDLEILERHSPILVDKDFIEYLLRTEGHKGITRHIDECREKLQREAVSPDGSNKQ